MKNYKKHITIICLLLFISSKFLNIHILTHDLNDHNDDCEVCEFVITTNKVLLTTDILLSYNLLISKQIFSKNIISEYVCIVIINNKYNSLFGRPPPMKYTYLL
ncbi:conserved protein of unknown function [Tenacibaculum sp. 190524A02b]|uniref:Uncharacterized protein n=1 Tax=Tenacibaculum vairaonense TaxID=3137860 RepID=A0ABP1FD64_9FLAO